MALLKRIIILAVAVMILPLAHSQQEGGMNTSVSRSMRTAIQFYNKGDDTQAMDRFMEILTKGDPSERSMANEYINLITQRMNTSGGYGGSPAAPKSGTASVESMMAVPPSTVKESVPPASESVFQEPAAPVAAPHPKKDAEMTPATKEVMRKEIKARLRAAQDKSLADLKEIEGVRVLMRANGDPDAIGIPSPFLFQSGISFQRDASKILNPLTKLVFSLGGTQVLILPEGTALGDAKVLDMRRTMGISAALYQAGVAPPRVQVNLLNTQLDLPKALADFKGVVVVFQYDRPMNLVVDSTVGEELGPPISLGIFPAKIRPSRNQGALIEFSVSDPPVGLVSWRFSLLQPTRQGAELTPLQEVLGGGAVFHQIFWNGRQNFFGHPLPSGRYECVLTAMDSKNRRRTLHKWIEVIGDDADDERLLAPPAAAAASEPTSATAPEELANRSRSPGSNAPSDDLTGRGNASLVKEFDSSGSHGGVEIKKGSSSQAKRKLVKRTVRAAAPGNKTKAGNKSAAKTAEAQRAPTVKKPGEFEIIFEKNTHQMKPASDKALAQVVAALSSYPLESLQISGHADSEEIDPDKLADRRAKLVIGLLINRYQVDPKRIQLASIAGAGAKVDILIVKNDQ